MQDKEKKKDKEPEKEKKKKRRKTETDSEEEREEFQLFFVEDRLTVAHRPNSQGSSATTGTLYPALVRKAWNWKLINVVWLRKKDNLFSSNKFKKREHENIIYFQLREMSSLVIFLHIWKSDKKHLTGIPMHF